MIPPVNPRRFALLIRRELLEMVYTPTVWFYALFAAAFVLFAALNPVDGLFDGAAGAAVSFMLGVSSGALAILPFVILVCGMFLPFVPGMGQRDVWQNTNRQHDRDMLPASRAEKHAAKLATSAWVIPFVFWVLAAVFAEAGVGIFSHNGGEADGGPVFLYEGNVDLALAMYWVCFYAAFLLVCRFGLPPRWVTAASVAVFVMAPFAWDFVSVINDTEYHDWEVSPMWLVAGVIAAFPIWLSVCRRDERVFAGPAKQTENKKGKKEKEDKTPRDAFAFAVPEKMSCLRRVAVLALTPEYRRMFYYCAAMAVMLPVLWMLMDWLFDEPDGEPGYGFEIQLYVLLMNLFAVMMAGMCASAITVSARAHVFFSLPASRAEKCAAIFAATYAAPVFVISLASLPWFAFYAGEFNARVAGYAADASAKAAWSYALVHSAAMLGFACGANRTARGNYEWVAAVVLAVLFLLFAVDFLSEVHYGSLYASGASMEGYSFAEDAARDLWRDNAGAAHLITEYWRAARGFFYVATPPVFWFLAWLKWQRG